jgi:hypothetical protein
VRASSGFRAGKTSRPKKLVRARRSLPECKRAVHQRRSLGAKRLGLLHELVTTASIIGLLTNRTLTAKSEARDVEAQLVYWTHDPAVEGPQ